MRGEVVLGAYTIGEEPVMLGGKVARALLPYEALFSHMLVVGTTGSGKTTFVKNFIKSLIDLKKGISIVCIDENGDYIQTIFDPQWDIEEETKRREEELTSGLYKDIRGLEEINIFFPVTRYFIEENNITDLKELAQQYYEHFLRKMHEQVMQSEEDVKYSCVINGKTSILTLTIVGRDGRKETRQIRIIPYVLNFKHLKSKIASLYPYFTARAREAFPNLIKVFEEEIENLKSKIAKICGSLEEPKLKVVENLEDLIYNLNEIEKWGDMYRKNTIAICASEAKMFPKTLENIIYGLHNINNMGIFDVQIGGKLLEEPPIDIFLKENSLTVLDLRPLGILEEEQLARGAKRILTLRILNRILGYKIEKEFERKKPLPPTIVLVDEAHRFFPRSAGTEEEREYIEYLSGALERIARLGRVRGLGLILSTHSPKDVHSAVLNLCNNKVVFRLEPSLAEELGLPKEQRDLVSRASDRVGVVTSHALRLHYATFKTPPPVLGHFKVRG
jgi:DNA helicase HerA-like ATPase